MWYPLPRIDDLLDRLGKTRYLSTFDLALGFWQIRMELSSQEKTAFITPHGLYEFWVMPTNSPAVFQRLIQQVLIGLNPTDGDDFVAAYIDDIFLIFSPTVCDHLLHLCRVIDCLREVNLKLKPTKCMFARECGLYTLVTLSLPQVSTQIPDSPMRYRSSLDRRTCMMSGDFLA